MTRSDDKIRTFICFETAPSLQAYLDQLIQEASRKAEPIKWVAAEKIHLTLKFLGDISVAQARQVAGVLDKIGAQTAPLHLRFNRLGAFPNFRAPRVFWLGCSEQSAALDKLVERLEDELAALGFAKEMRAYTPHLTIGRPKDRHCRQTSRFLESYVVQPQELTGDKLVLMRSELHPSGAKYTPIKSVALVR